MVTSFSSAANQVNKKVVIAIDAGHGGKDPGALGQNGLKEKDVNFAVAKKLQALLEKDPLFQPVLTRTGDYFISVSERSDIARTKNANFLVSIHADAAQNTSANGASVWVLSNKRADTELGRWLEQQDKQSELLGGGGNALAHGNDNPYLSQTVIDLQFAHSQRVGYDVAVNVLKQLDKLGGLHKNKPEHVSFGVLRSPDIPSILVEVGFISNKNEEKLLGSSNYQNKIANAIYQGIRSYFIENPLHPTTSGQAVANTNSNSNANANMNSSGQTAAANSGSDRPAVASPNSQNGVHVVKADETLFSIARQYNMSVANLRELNDLKGDTIRVGQKLNVSAVKTTSRTSTAPASTAQTGNAAKPANSTNKTQKQTKYTVVAGDSLSVIAQKHGASTSELKRVNNLTSDNVRIGQILIIP